MNCFTRLRVDVYDMSKIDDEKINKLKNTGIIKGKSNVQIAVGMRVEEICEEVNKVLGRED